MYHGKEYKRLSAYIIIPTLYLELIEFITGRTTCIEKLLTGGYAIIDILLSMIATLLVMVFLFEIYIFIDCNFKLNFDLFKIQLKPVSRLISKLLIGVIILSAIKVLLLFI